MTYGPVCPPFNHGSGQSFQFERQFAQESEDCLRVNIWTPGANDNRKRPVLFWLHSMGFHSGSGHDFRVYDGANLARRGDVVVVSINHRTNILGFCNLVEYGERYADSANVGLLDIVAALRWVRDNIGGFGGDPGNVTVFGQSGGGMKVCSLLAMPGAQGLFHKSIVQSGPQVRLGSQELSLKLTAGLLQELQLNRNTLSRLHEIDFRDLRAAALRASRRPLAPWPCVDGRNVPAHPFDPLAPALSAGIPLLIGTTLHDGTVLDEPLSEELLKGQLLKRYPKTAGRVYDALKGLFPAATPNERLALGTAVYRRDSMKIAKRKAALNRAPVHAFIFAWETPILPERSARATHFMDLPFVFDNTDLCRQATGGTAQARRLAARMSDAWIHFARTGDPNHGDLPRWPPCTAEREATMFFNDRCEVKREYDRDLLTAIEDDAG
jgi:para-nitrobenzyl esterase